MSDLPRPIALELERVEVEACRSSTGAPPAEAVAVLGFGMRPMGSGLAVLAGRADVLRFNCVFGLGVGSPARETDLDEAISFYRDAGVPRFMVSLAPCAGPPALGAWLEARGFYLHNRWIKLWRPTSDPVEDPRDPRVREIGPEHAGALADCTTEAFGLPADFGPWLSASIGHPGWGHYAAFDGATPVGFGALFVSGGAGWLGMAGTLPSHRRQGIQSAIIAARLREAARLGCGIVVVETADDTPEKPNPSTHNLVRAGFRVAYRRPNWVKKFENESPSP